MPLTATGVLYAATALISVIERLQEAFPKRKIQQPRCSSEPIDCSDALPEEDVRKGRAQKSAWSLFQSRLAAVSR